MAYNNNNYYGYPQAYAPSRKFNVEQLRKQRDDLNTLLDNMQQQPVIQQNFVQQAFQSDFDAKWIDNKNEINNIVVNRDSIFMDKNNPIFYLKTPTGETKAYTFTEYIELDEKDLKIKELEEKLAKFEKEGKEDGKSVVQSKQNKSKQSDRDAE